MHRKVILLGVGVLMMSMFAANAEAGWSGNNFHSPSGNIRCFFFSNTIHCGSLASDTWIDLPKHAAWRKSLASFSPEPSHTLYYGQRWTTRDSALSCKSLFTGMSCSNVLGYRFVISRSHWSGWYRSHLMASG